MSVSVERLDTRRWGLKGPQAAAWLHEQHVVLPEASNAWTLLDHDPGSLILRLGTGEFLFDERLPTTARSRCQVLAAELFEPVPGVYPVVREDTSLELRGSGTERVLAEAGSFDFGSLESAARQVVRTLLFAVPVIVIAQGTGGTRCYRIWCDPSYGSSLYAALSNIATDTAEGWQTRVGSGPEG